jgi:hypothetical protein
MIEFVAMLLIGLALILILGTGPTAIPLNVPAGKDCHAYANTGTHGSPTWAAVDNIQDVKLGDAVTQFGMKLRLNRPFETNIPTLLAWNPTFKIADISGDALFAALLAAKTNGTALDMTFLDGAVTPATGVTSQGPRADWTVEKMDRDEASENGVMYDVSLKAAQTGNVPAWFSVTGS